MPEVTDVKKDWFCESWPATEEVIVFMIATAKNIWIKLALIMVKSAGTALHKKYCGTKD